MKPNNKKRKRDASEIINLTKYETKIGGKPNQNLNHDQF